MSINFEQLKDEYATLWRTMSINHEKIPIIDRVATKRLAGKARYQFIANRTGVPWAAIAVIHQMECGGDWNANLAQGDPWNQVSTHVPKGRGPFTSFEEAAIDALSIDGTSSVRNWTIERLCFELEKYNGFGSRNKGIHTPYLWSYSNHYRRGKYIADHVWDPNAVSQQVGAMPLLSRMMMMDPSIILTSALPPPKPTVPTPPPIPVVAKKSVLASLFSALIALFKTRG